ncbi:endonuclease DDE [Microvirga vignae]|uniref:Endonuclease DDE n=2 Tax=Microvirga vignae TaxID=1225564 RepID=A0A0H1RDC2_9HYPH|nr:endonuclease DDE [Microvirga vignae]
MRKRPAAAQAERRRQVVGLRESGLTYDAIAAQVGLTRTGVFNICRHFAEQGRTAGTDLARWGFTAQKPLRRAYEQSPKAVRRWLRQDDSAVVAQARGGKRTIFWGDETGLRSADGRGRSFAPRGVTPVMRPCHKRARLGLISALTNTSELRWMVLEGALKAPRLIHFPGRLIQEASGKVFLLWENLPVHRARAVRDWLAERKEPIEVFHLPAYSPELNPYEGLNADLKHAVTRKPPARSKPELKRAVISHMRRMTKLPERIRSYFRHQPFRYAA